MTLNAGTKLGPYEILAAIGAGGMGEVYRARDTKLNRDVAIKILPGSFAHDPERVARFKREAQVLAALNHPHIAAIHGFEDSSEVHALVLELVEGPTLADLIAERASRAPAARASGGGAPRALEMAEALPIARQIAEALETAHEQGIIHRDLKPANIKVKDDGMVKVLDFGLAKAMEQGSGIGNQGSVGATNSPTITSPAMMTGVGMILGTAAYMAPEQAKGGAVDKRADIWAFGCVLYEILTGKRAFEGEDVSDTLAFVITKEPDWAALPANTPAVIRKLLRRCLEKDRKRRLDSIAVARLDIEDTLAAPSVDASVVGPASVAVRPAGWRRALPWAVAVGVLGVAGAVLLFWAPWRSAPPTAPVHLSAEIGADASLVTDPGGAAAAVLSPDGALLVFVAQKTGGSASQLFVRQLDQLQAAALSGTEGASGPFFSPDGQWVAFFAGGQLKKIAVTGGAAVTLCDAPNGRGGSWAEDGTIAFTPTLGAGVNLLRVSSAGGKPQSLTTLDQGEVAHRWPQVLPGGKAVLYTAATSGVGDANLVVQTLPTGARKVVQPSGYHGRYVSSGHLVYMHEGTLFAAPFDLNRLEVSGPSVPVLEGVISNPVSGGTQFAVTGNGTLVYLPGQSRLVGSPAPIVWMDREGKTSALRATPANWANPRFAPDGQRLAMYINDGRQSDVWVYDWARDTLSRFTFDPANDVYSAWTPDGLRIAFASARADKATLNLYWQRADGTGEIQRLTESKNRQAPTSWHPGGKFLAFHEANPQTNADVMILPMEGDEASGWKPGTPTVFLNSPFNEWFATFSPDGRWLAYSSSESGRSEVYVRPFPGPGGKWQISANGGTLSVWSRARRELFYEALQPDDRIMVASYTTAGDSFRAEKPRVWADRPFGARPDGWDFDLHPDGDRVAVAPVPEAQTAAQQDKVVFIFNFFDELRRLAPTAGK